MPASLFIITHWWNNVRMWICCWLLVPPYFRTINIDMIVYIAFVWIFQGFGRLIPQGSLIPTLSGHATYHFSFVYVASWERSGIRWHDKKNWCLSLILRIPWCLSHSKYFEHPEYWGMFHGRRSLQVFSLILWSKPFSAPLARVPGTESRQTEMQITSLCTLIGLS